MDNVLDNPLMEVKINYAYFLLNSITAYLKGYKRSHKILEWFDGKNGDILQLLTL